MDIVVRREQFQRAVGLVEHATARNASLPILANILIEATSTAIKLSATNLEVGVSASLPGTVADAGRVVVPAKVLYDFLRASRGDTVSLKSAGGSLKVSIGRAHTSLVIFDAAEYPIIPKIEGGVTFSLPTGDLCSLISGVLDCVATSDSRPELAGAFLRFEPTGTIVAATDSFRLAERRIAAEHKGTSSVIIPRSGAIEALRVFHETTGDVQVRISDNQISFTHPDVEVISRLVDGTYPDYQKVIPDRSTARVLVRRDDLEEAVRVAALFSSSISDVRLECADASLTVSGRNATKGEAQATLEAHLKGDSFDVSMNCNYLLDGLKAVASERVVLEFTGKGSAFVLRPEQATTGTVYLIMPLRA